MQHYQAISGNNGVAVVGAGPNAGREYLINSSANRLAFIGEFDLGCKYHVTQRLRLTAGYRVVAISGVAHGMSQVFPRFAGIQDVEAIDSNGSLLLHGGYAGRRVYLVRPQIPEVCEADASEAAPRVENDFQPAARCRRLK
jgi:hypothetical protein